MNEKAKAELEEVRDKTADAKDTAKSSSSGEDTPSVVIVRND